VRDDVRLLPQEQAIQGETTTVDQPSLAKVLPPKASPSRESALPQGKSAAPAVQLEAPASLSANSSSGNSAVAAAASVPSAATTSAAAPLEGDLNSKVANGAHAVAKGTARGDDDGAQAPAVRPLALRPHDASHAAAPTSKSAASGSKRCPFAPSERTAAPAPAAPSLPCCAARAPSPASSRASVTVDTPAYATSLRVPLPPGAFDPPSDEEVSRQAAQAVVTQPLGPSQPPGPTQPSGPGSGELLNPGHVTVAMVDRREPGNLLAAVPLTQCTTLLGRVYLHDEQLLTASEMVQYAKGLQDERVEARTAAADAKMRAYMYLLKRTSQTVRCEEIQKPPNAISECLYSAISSLCMCFTFVTFVSIVPRLYSWFVLFVHVYVRRSTGVRFDYSTRPFALTRQAAFGSQTFTVARARMCCQPNPNTAANHHRICEFPQAKRKRLLWVNAFY